MPNADGGGVIQDGGAGRQTDSLLKFKALVKVTNTENK